MGSRQPPLSKGCRTGPGWVSVRERSVDATLDVRACVCATVCHVFPHWIGCMGGASQVISTNRCPQPRLLPRAVPNLSHRPRGWRHPWGVCDATAQDTTHHSHGCTRGKTSTPEGLAQHSRSDVIHLRCCSQPGTQGSRAPLPCGLFPGEQCPEAHPQPEPQSHVSHRISTSGNVS